MDLAKRQEIAEECKLGFSHPSASDAMRKPTPATAFTYEKGDGVQTGADLLMQRASPSLDQAGPSKGLLPLSESALAARTALVSPPVAASPGKEKQ